MPLRAQIDGHPINAALLSNAEWQALKGSRSLQMPCCGAPAYRRTSRLGTRHFSHSPGQHCGTDGESAEHLAAKAEIVRACDELGWEADSEVVGDGWRADVLACRERHRLAFEIQWSRQTLELTRQRQATYGHDVKCCWLFRALPPAKRIAKGRQPDQGAIAEQSLAMFRLSRRDEEFLVTVDAKLVPLREFVRARLQRRIRFARCRNYLSHELQVVAPEVPCWRCGCHYHVLYTRWNLRSDCGAELSLTDPGDARVPDDRDPYSAKFNMRLLKEHFPTRIPELHIKLDWRWSQTIGGRSYWCFCCPHCMAFLGSHCFLFTVADAGGYELPPLCSKELPCFERWPQSHWCFPANGRFCG